MGGGGSRDPLRVPAAQPLGARDGRALRPRGGGSSRPGPASSATQLLGPAPAVSLGGGRVPAEDKDGPGEALGGAPAASRVAARVISPRRRSRDRRGRVGGPSAAPSRDGATASWLLFTQEGGCVMT